MASDTSAVNFSSARNDSTLVTIPPVLEYTTKYLVGSLHKSTEEYYALHSVAIVCLLTSIILASLNVHTVRTCGRHVRFSERPLAERLILYMALSDLSYSLAHMVDHVYMLVAYDHPPRGLCVTIAFCITTLALTESLLVMLASLNACVMTVLWRRMKFGPYDVGIIMVALGLPLIVGIINLSIGAYGPSRAWCGLSVTNKYGLWLNNIYTIGFLFVFVFCAVCYAWIWATIKTAYRKAHLNTSGSAEPQGPLTYSAISRQVSSGSKGCHTATSPGSTLDTDGEIQGEDINLYIMCDNQRDSHTCTSTERLRPTSDHDQDINSNSDYFTVEITGDEYDTINRSTSLNGNGDKAGEIGPMFIKALDNSPGRHATRRQGNTNPGGENQSSLSDNPLEYTENAEKDMGNSTTKLSDKKPNKAAVRWRRVLDRISNENLTGEDDDVVSSHKRRKSSGEFHHKLPPESNSIRPKDLLRNGAGLPAKRKTKRTSYGDQNEPQSNDNSINEHSNAIGGNQGNISKAEEPNHDRKLRRLNRTAKIMSVFVGMFALQWAWYLTYSVWDMVGTPHISIIFLVVIFTNLGGAFNYYAYTYLRGKYTGTATPRSHSSGQQVYSISQTEK